MHKFVHRDLFCKPRHERGRRRREPNRGGAQLPAQHAAACVLIIIILSSWALDSMHVEWVPRPVHENVAAFTDSMLDRLQQSPLFSAFYSALPRNPIDNSPFTFGSEILLGVLCAGGLIAISASSMLRVKE